MRADRLIVDRGLAPTRSAAQRLIAHGGVRWRLAAAGRAEPPWRALAKAGDELPADCALEVVDDAETRWASRGGLKLEAALERTGLEVTGRDALDLGQSTGGFTDVLLARGARRVVGVDVGHGQLHPRLAADPRVVALEGVNVRALAPATGAAVDLAPQAAIDPRVAAALEGGFDLVVADLSFISLVRALPAVARLLRADGDALLLVKPQFELQPEDIGKGGLVRDPAAPVRVEARIRNACVQAGLEVRDWFDSAIAGGDGNREFFVHARHRDGDMP
jgi:23S rRNA (cytidine1920-2'-O)/16S rRNA (cytidine1409-2'-O)-methyltransferase